jgi:hypothetical protein
MTQKRANQQIFNLIFVNEDASRMFISYLDMTEESCVVY